MKYVLVTVGGIHVQIAQPTKLQGYTEGIIECMLPDEENMTDKESRKWIKENNNRMNAICNFLNENDL